MLITLISLAINDLKSYLSVFNNTILYVNNDCVFCRWISDVKRHNFFCSHLQSAAVVKKSLTTETLSNSPSLNMLLICKLMFCFVF